MHGGVKGLWHCHGLLLMALLLFGCQDSTVDYPARSMPEGLRTDAAALKAGEVLFQSKCTSCHGKPSEGRSDRAAFFTPAAPDFTDTSYREKDPAYLYWRIEVGKNAEPYRSQGSVMPAWGMHFSAEQTWQVVAYLQSRAH